MCVQNGDEQAVVLLLEADLGLTKTTFQDESISGPQLSEESHVHLDAMNRYVLHALAIDGRYTTNKYYTVSSISYAVLESTSRLVNLKAFLGSGLGYAGNLFHTCLVQ